MESVATVTVSGIRVRQQGYDSSGRMYFRMSGHRHTLQSSDQTLQTHRHTTLLWQINLAHCLVYVHSNKDLKNKQKQYY